MLDAKLARKVDSRLSRIEGQIRGIRKMVEGGRYCVDVLDQIAAVRAALGAVGQVVMRNHIETCVASALASPNRHDREEKISELVKLYPRFCRGG